MGSFFWFVSFLILLLIELITVGLVSVWFAVGSLVAFIVSLFIENALLENSVFILISVIALFITKPIVSRFKNRDKIRTNLDRIVGEHALVLRDIRKYESGEVKVLGSIWTATSDEEILKGEEVLVLSVEGAKVRVQKLPK